MRDAFERIRSSLAAKARDARFEGVAVQPMARNGVELIAGTFRDDRFGPIVMVGLGGVFVEVMKDTSLALAPIGGREASGMLARLAAPRFSTASAVSPVSTRTRSFRSWKQSRELPGRIPRSPRWISIR